MSGVRHWVSQVTSAAVTESWFDELAEFLRIPSISADPAHAGDVVRAGDWVCAFIRAAGGTCGVVYFHVTLRTGQRDLHSGVFGGAALNAAHALLHTLDALVAHDGTLVEPLRKGIAEPTPAELEGWTELPTGAEELAEQGARA